MWEGYYPSEPFDLRLTVLRLVRNLWWIILLTLLGTLVFGGGYYLKYVVFGEAPDFAQTVTCKIEYTDLPTKSGDYYINEMTWNTYVVTDEFVGMVKQSLAQFDAQVAGGAYATTAAWWDTNRADAETVATEQSIVSVKVASDVQVPSFTVRTPNQTVTETLAQAVADAVTGEFADSLPEVASIRVIDVTQARLVKADVRPGRAFVLSAVLSGFFVLIFYLLWEIGADSIWLPATLARRYGLPVAGTIHSAQLRENMRYLLQGKQRVAVCAIRDEMDPAGVIASLKEVLQEDAAGGEADEELAKDWIAVPSPDLSPETVRAIRQAEGLLLVVPAGMHVGKMLEQVLDFYRTQEITVTAALLWDADEALIRGYYLLPGGRQ